MLVDNTHLRNIVPVYCIICYHIISSQEGPDVSDEDAFGEETYELNPDHTHFLIVEDGGSDPGSPSIRCQIEDQFRRIYGVRPHKPKPP